MRNRKFLQQVSADSRLSPTEKQVVKGYALAVHAVVTESNQTERFLGMQNLYFQMAMFASHTNNEAMVQAARFAERSEGLNLDDETQKAMSEASMAVAVLNSMLKGGIPKSDGPYKIAFAQARIIHDRIGFLSSAVSAEHLADMKARMQSEYIQRILANPPESETDFILDRSVFGEMAPFKPEVVSDVSLPSQTQKVMRNVAVDEDQQSRTTVSLESTFSPVPVSQTKLGQERKVVLQQASESVLPSFSIPPQMPYSQRVQAMGALWIGLTSSKDPQGDLVKIENYLLSMNIKVSLGGSKKKQQVISIFPLDLTTHDYKALSNMDQYLIIKSWHYLNKTSNGENPDFSRVKREVAEDLKADTTLSRNYRDYEHRKLMVTMQQELYGHIQSAESLLSKINIKDLKSDSANIALEIVQHLAQAEAILGFFRNEGIRFKPAEDAKRALLTAELFVNQTAIYDLIPDQGTYPSVFLDHFLTRPAESREAANNHANTELWRMGRGEDLAAGTNPVLTAPPKLQVPSSSKKKSDPHVPKDLSHGTRQTSVSLSSGEKKDSREETLFAVKETDSEATAYNAAVNEVLRLYKLVAKGAKDDPVAQLEYFENLAGLVTALDAVPSERGTAEDQSALMQPAAELIQQQFEAAVNQAMQAAMGSSNGTKKDFTYNTRFKVEHSTGSETKSEPMSVMQLAASMHSKKPGPVYTHDSKSLPQFFDVLAFIANRAIFMGAVFSSPTFGNLADTKNPASGKGETYGQALFRLQAIHTKLQAVFANPPDVKGGFMNWSSNPNPLAGKYDRHASTVLMRSNESGFDAVFPPPTVEVVVNNPYEGKDAVRIYEEAAAALTGAKPGQKTVQVGPQDVRDAIQALTYLVHNTSPDDLAKSVSVGGANLEAGMAAFALHIVNSLLPMKDFKDIKQEELPTGFLALAHLSGGKPDHEVYPGLIQQPGSREQKEDLFSSLSSTPQPIVLEEWQTISAQIAFMKELNQALATGAKKETVQDFVTRLLDAHGTMNSRWTEVNQLKQGPQAPSNADEALAQLDGALSLIEAYLTQPHVRKVLTNEPYNYENLPARTTGSEEQRELDAAGAQKLLARTAADLVVSKAFAPPKQKTSSLPLPKRTAPPVPEIRLDVSFTSGKIVEALQAISAGLTEGSLNNQLVLELMATRKAMGQLYQEINVEGNKRAPNADLVLRELSHGINLIHAYLTQPTVRSALTGEPFNNPEESLFIFTIQKKGSAIGEREVSVPAAMQYLEQYAKELIYTAPTKEASHDEEQLLPPPPHAKVIKPVVLDEQYTVESVSALLETINGSLMSDDKSDVPFALTTVLQRYEAISVLYQELNVVEGRAPNTDDVLIQLNQAMWLIQAYLTQPGVSDALAGEGVENKAPLPEFQQETSKGSGKWETNPGAASTYIQHHAGTLAYLPPVPKRALTPPQSRKQQQRVDETTVSLVSLIDFGGTGLLPQTGAHSVPTTPVEEKKESKRRVATEPRKQSGQRDLLMSSGIQPLPLTLPAMESDKKGIPEILKDAKEAMAAFATVEGEREQILALQAIQGMLQKIDSQLGLDTLTQRPLLDYNAVSDFLKLETNAALLKKAASSPLNSPRDAFLTTSVQLPQSGEKKQGEGTVFGNNDTGLVISTTQQFSQ